MGLVIFILEGIAYGMWQLLSQLSVLYCVGILALDHKTCEMTDMSIIATRRAQVAYPSGITMSSSHNFFKR